VCGVASLVVGCGALLGTINVEADVTCSWAREAPEWSIEVIDDISNSNLSDTSLEALNESDDFQQKHNELFLRNC